MDSFAKNMGGFGGAFGGMQGLFGNGSNTNYLQGFGTNLGSRG
jgi:hypothetical protein